MKLRNFILAGVIAATLLNLSQFVLADNPTATQPVASPAVAAILTATDASTVVAAYAKALAENPSDQTINAAYIQRMIDLGSPELAAVQAQTLTKNDPQNGLAWAVTSYTDMKQGNYGRALTEIIPAVHGASDSPFVLKTAGELLGWYSSQPNKPTLPQDVQLALSNINETMGTKLVYANAYNRATVTVRRATFNKWESVQAQSRVDTTTLAQTRHVPQPIYPTRPLPYYPVQNQPPAVLPNLPGYSSPFNFGRPNYLPGTVILPPVVVTGGGVDRE